MALNKTSADSDRIANLYRAAYYLAKNSKDVAINFIKKSELKINISKINSKKSRLILAEKILDEYVRLKNFS